MEDGFFFIFGLRFVKSGGGDCGNDVENGGGIGLRKNAKRRKGAKNGWMPGASMGIFYAIYRELVVNFYSGGSNLSTC